MPRYIPIALHDALREDATTTCWLLRIIPVIAGISEYGITSLDQDVLYDDGDGELLYRAPVGLIPAAVVLSSNLSVNNTELPSLLPEYDVPISEADIRAGNYDFAQFKFYLVNYRDLTQGHITLHAGTLGQQTINSDGLSFVNELRAIAATLKQSVCSKDSLTCRAIFGSQPIGSPVPGPQVQRDWCGYDAESLLVEAVVQSVGFESNRTFDVAPDTSMFEDSLSPGMVFWRTGLNAGRSNEVESNTADGEINLAFETSFPIQVGDQLKYRPDCNKQPRNTEKGCKFWFGSEWVNHVRAEPDIPLGDAGAMETPGASSGPGQGGRTSEPLESPE